MVNKFLISLSQILNLFTKSNSFVQLDLMHFPSESLILYNSYLCMYVCTYKHKKRVHKLF